MKILLITHQGNIAGSTNSIAFLAKGLADKGHNVYLGCRRESLLYSLCENTKVNLVPMTFRRRFDLGNMKQIRDIVRIHNIDIINAQSSIDRYTTILARWIYKLPVKLVHTRRQKPQSIGGPLQNWFYIKGVDKVVAISDRLKQTFVEKGYPADHIEVIYNGTPAERYSHLDEEKVKRLKEKFGIEEGDVVIGCISRRKKQEQIIEALQFLNPSYKILFAGIEPGSLDKEVKRFNIKNEIIYAGLIDPGEILCYYKLLTVNVLASTMDGFGLVLVEAMALGVPVIGTRSQGIINVIEDGVNGFLYSNQNAKQLAEKLDILINDRQKRSEFIENGKKTAFKKFSMENTIANYEHFFQNLINGN